MRVHSFCALMFGALAVVGGARPAHADAAADAASAKQLFERGRDLRVRGDCAGALPLFQKAYALYRPGLGSLRNIAVCQEALNHFASARSAWLELRHAIANSEDAKYVGWSEDADRAMARLAPKISTLTVDLAVSAPPGASAPPGPSGTEGAAPEGVEVSVDGQPLAKERIGTLVEHDPGTLVVRAEGEGVVAPAEQTITLAPGESRRITLHLALSVAPDAAKPDADEAPAAEPAAPLSGASIMRTAAWAAMGVGVAGAVGAAVSFGIRQAALGDLNASCPNHASAPCDPSQHDAVTSDVHRGETASTLLNVFAVAGIAGAVTSVVLFTLSRSPSSQSAVVLTPTGFAATGSF